LRIQEQLANEMRLPVHALRGACMRLVWASLTADAEDVARAEARIRELADGVDEIPGHAILELNRYARAAVRNDAAGMVSALAEWELRMGRDPKAAKMMSLLRAVRLSHQDRREEARAAIFEFFPKGPQHAVLGPLVLAFATPACIRIGDEGWLEGMYDSLLPYAERNSVYPFMSVGPYAFHLGCLAAALGRREKAIEHFRRAIALSERAGFADYVVRIRRELRLVVDGDALQAPPPLHGPVVATAELFELQQQGEYWTLRHEGREARLRDTKGLHYLATLLREPGREFHVADLAGLHAGDLGDAGDMLDARARIAYQERLARLADALEDAEARGDRDGAARVRGEREALGDELSRAIGLGGRSRKSSATAERARVNVQRRIRDVITRVSEVDAAMGRHLERHVKTGFFCSWER
ncbi:MAG TPA: hypothetical protein VNO21_23275, partial [Polyangiaceae bacterium]|nr:hypothetical protein [Polyangiaceae bacterium]